MCLLHFPFSLSLYFSCRLQDFGILLSSALFRASVLSSSRNWSGNEMVSAGVKISSSEFYGRLLPFPKAVCISNLSWTTYLLPFYLYHFFLTVSKLSFLVFLLSDSFICYDNILNSRTLIFLSSKTQFKYCIETFFIQIIEFEYSILILFNIMFLHRWEDFS